MIRWLLERRRAEPTFTRREAMIRETNAFLTWATSRDRGLPRVPARPTDRGGFAHVIRKPGARALARHIWHRLMRNPWLD